MSRTAQSSTHLFRAMKAPAAARALPKLAERARQEEWSYERFAEALLSTEVSSRESSRRRRLRIRAARFPAHKTLEEFDFTFQRSVKKQVIEHLGQLDFLHAKRERDPARPARHRQDPPLDRARDPRVPRRPARPVQDRDRMGRAARPTRNARAGSTTSSTASSGSRC